MVMTHVLNLADYKKGLHYLSSLLSFVRFYHKMNGSSLWNQGTNLEEISKLYPMHKCYQCMYQTPILPLIFSKDMTKLGVASSVA